MADERTYNRDEVVTLITAAANIGVGAWLDPGRYCPRGKEESLGDWCSRAKAIAIQKYIEHSLVP